MLTRLTHVLFEEAKRWGRVESAGRDVQVDFASPMGGRQEEPFVSAFRIVVVDPPVGARVFTVMVTETRRL